MEKAVEGRPGYEAIHKPPPKDVILEGQHQADAKEPPEPRPHGPGEEPISYAGALQISIGVFPIP